MKAKDFLKLAGVKNEQEFYEKFPTEEAFFNAFPQTAKFRQGGSINERLNQDQITMGSYTAPSKGMEVFGTALDILTGNVIQGFTGKSISGMMGVNKRKGSMFSQIEDTTNEAASGILGAIFPMAKPFIQIREGMRTAIAPAIGGTTVGGTDLLGEAGANAIRGASKAIGSFAGGMMGGGFAGGMMGGGSGQGMMGGGSGQGMMSGMMGNIMGGNKDGSLQFRKGGPIGGMTQANQLEEIDGYSHEQGGTMIADGIEAEKGEAKINVKGQGDFIFSDKIINPMTNKSYAKEAKSIQKEKGNLWRSSWDTATKRYFEKRMQELANKQERQKQMQQQMLMEQQGYEQPINPNQQMNPMMMRWGGPVDPNRPNLWAPNDRINFNFEQPNLQRKAYLNTTLPSNKPNVFKDNRKNIFDKNYQFDVTKNKVVEKDSYDLNKRNIKGGVDYRTKDGNLGGKGGGYEGSYQEAEPNYAQSMIPGMVGSGIGPAANFLAAALAPDGRLNPHVSLNTVNAAIPTSIAMRQANESKAGYINAVRNNAYTAGSFLGNMGAVYPQANAESASAIADLNYRINQGNVETKNRQEIINQGITTANNLIQDQSTAQRWNLGLKGAENLGQNLMGIGRDRNMMNRDLSMLGMTDQANYKIVYDPKTNGFKKVFISDLEEEEEENKNKKTGK